MIAPAEITPEMLRALIDYDPSTGTMTWKHRGIEWFNGSRAHVDFKVWNKKYAGTPALACPDAHGYLVGALLGLNMKAHRVAWAIQYGEWPTAGIDHENGCVSDNRIANLGEADQQTNGRNVALHRSNTSGRIGVVRRRDCNRWVAQIGVGDRCVYLGLFATFEEACAARAAAELANDFHPNHGRVRRAR